MSSIQSRFFMLLFVLTATFACAQSDPVTIETTSGETLKGTFIVQGETEAIFQSNSAGQLTIPVANIKRILNADGQTVLYAPQPKPGLFGSEMLSRWTKEFELGISGAEGNTDSFAGNTALRFETDNESYRSKFGAWYFLSLDNDERSRNEARVYGTYDKYLNDINPKVFMFAKAQYDYDEFQPWKNRVSAFIGPGYDFMKEDPWTLTGRTGIGFSQEFGGDDEEFRIEALLGIDGSYKIDPNQKLAFSVYYYPSLEDFNDGRIDSALTYTADINKAKGLAVRMGVVHEYELRTIGDADHNDWKYFANMLLKF